MPDKIVRATAANGQIRAFAIDARNLVEEARKYHNTSPVATAALGRLLSGGAMMGAMMKGDKDILTLQIKGSGLMRGITVTADSKGNVKGYPHVSEVIIPANDKGKLDVARAIGPGILSVIKDLGMKEPYVGQTVLQTSEIAEDLTYYFATSEQVPSAVGLGVLMNKNNTVRQAGGFIIQLMPFASDEVIEKLEKEIAKVTSVTKLMEEGLTVEGILRRILGEQDLEIHHTIPARFYCNCSKDKIKKVITSIGKKDLQEMVDDNVPIEINCHFCNKSYEFTPKEIQGLMT